MIKAEQETVVRWDQEERIAFLWTAYEPQARRWQRAGYPVRVVGRTREGEPRTWAAEVPAEAIRWSKLNGGKVAKRTGHRKGRLLGFRNDELIANPGASTADGGLLGTVATSVSESTSSSERHHV